ncbi:MAG: HepT-like ribonuclease domain-containing protein, partial [bacterium]
AAGLAASEIPCLLVEGDNRPGLGYAIAARLAEAGIDAVVLTKSQNVTYITGFAGTAGLAVVTAEDVFLVLERAGVVDRNLGVRLRALTRFRNILVHDYVAVDHAIVHRHLREGLSDFREFAGAIVRYLDRADE